MTIRTRPACTGGHHPRYTNMDFVFEDLPCGCQNTLYADGARCYEHAHVDCDGTPEETR